MIIFLLLATLYSSTTFALAIDQKLQATILDVSNTKKTILINRGAEDKLALKDFAKISDTQTGLFARATLVKLAPHRSIWSIYKIYHEKLIFKGKQATFKIIAPVPLTSDKTRALKPKDEYIEPSSTSEDFIGTPKSPNQKRDNLLAPRNPHQLATYFDKLEKIHTSGKDPNEDWSNLDIPDEHPTRYDNIDFSELDKFL